MKRFSLFLFALFALLMGVPPQAALAKAGDVVTNLSNLSNSKVYNIKSLRGYLLYSANYTGKLAGSAGSGVKDAGTASATAAAQQFAIYTVGGKHFLYSVGAKKFVSSNGNYESAPNTELSITATGNANNPWLFKLGSNTINMQAKGGDAAGCVVNSWATADDGNRLTIVEATLDEATDIESPMVPLLQNVYNGYVAQLKAANGMKYFYHDASDAINSLPATAPATKAELETAIANLQTTINGLDSAEGVLGTDLNGKTLFIGNLQHSKMYMSAQGKGGNVLGSDESGWQVNHAWVFEKADKDNTYYIKNAESGMYIGAIPAKNDVCVPLVADKASAQVYTVAYAGKTVIATSMLKAEKPTAMPCTWLTGTVWYVGKQLPKPQNSVWKMQPMCLPLTTSTTLSRWPRVAILTLRTTM